MRLEQFISRVEGQVVSFDGLPSNAGQSVQLLAEWCHFLGLPFQWTSPAYWWDDSDSAFQDYWTKIPYSPNNYRLPQPGDIIIFSEELPGSGGHGHGTIFLRDTGPDSWEGLDANWGGKSVHTQSHTWAYVLGWFTPKYPSVLESEIPIPIADEAPYAPYDMQIIGAKIITTSKQPTTLYNLNNVDYASLLQNPISHVPKDFEVTVTAVAKHRLGGTYYMPDSEKAEGYLLEDCDDYTSDEETEEAKELIPKETNAALNSIFAPLAAPNMNDVVKVDKRIPYYQSMSDALLHRDPRGTLAPTNYYVFKRMPNGMLSITAQPGQSMRTWIDPADLEEPKPFDWKKAMDALMLYETPKHYEAIQDGLVIDVLTKGKTIPIRKGQIIQVDGEVYGKDSSKWAVPTTTRAQGKAYVVTMDILKPWVKPPIQEPAKVELGPLQYRSPNRSGKLTGLGGTEVNTVKVPYPVPLPELPLSARMYLKARKFLQNFKETW